MPAKERQLRKEAVEIAAQLPENTEDALAVLKYASELVRWFVEDYRPLNVETVALSNGAETSRMRRPKPIES